MGEFGSPALAHTGATGLKTEREIRSCLASWQRGDSYDGFQ